MKILVDQDTGEVYGSCDACKAEINFSQHDAEFTAPGGYYEADEIVNKWMDHQLNDCPQQVIDNSPRIG